VLDELSPARSCLYVGSGSASFYLASAPRCPDSCTCVMYWYKLLYCYTILLLDSIFCLHGVLLSLCPMPMPQFRHLLNSCWSLKIPSCLSRSCSASAAVRAALASAARCLSASLRCLVPVSRGVAASPCVVFCAVSVCTCAGAFPVPGGFPPWGSPKATVSSTRCTCSSAGGAPAQLHCKLSISLYCRVLITLQPCLTFLPLTLVIKPHRKQLA
jgi:hypothetical protein